MYYELFSEKRNRSLLHAFHCGIERESLRVTDRGELSKSPHPKALGSPLTHPHISTDFSEQQIEWNTPPFNSFQKATRYMEELIQFSLKNIDDELLWPYSMPPHIDHVEIAQFGSSFQGRKKEIYRKGLKERYGMNLQMISGIHFNFSFDKAFWKKLHAYENSPLSLQDFIDKKYLGIIRNFLCEGWLLTYLFGTSPAMDASYTSLPKNFKKGKDFYYAPYGTSIRTSNLGYYSRVQNQLAISFNTLNSYLSELRKAISTPKKEYQTIETQLNDHILQIENEHYSRIRPKRSIHKGESPIEALEKRGIEYLEIRSIDLNPNYSIGVCPEQLEFIHLFLLHCLFKKSPILTKQTQQCLTCNQNSVAIEGRNPNLILSCPTPISMKTWGRKILKKLEPLAELLGYEKNLKVQKEKIENPTICPSALILEEILKDGLQKKALSLAKSHKKSLLKKKLSLRKLHSLETLAKSSHIENQRLETASEVLVEGYESFELSTQVLIREALKRKVKIQVLDAEDHILRLEKKRHIEYIKEATKTSKDKYITSYLLENKEITKKLLFEKGFSVPMGKTYSTIDSALADYSLYQKKKVVVKPKSTNFGLGVFFIKPNEKQSYAYAIESAFFHGSSIIVENFCPGEEFRFLVIDGKVIGVAKRDPANVIGDGKQTIKALVHEKNHDPSYYRDPKTYIHLGRDEKEMLRSQRLTLRSIPKKGRKIYLRHNSNVSTGGDSLDMTDSVHKGYHKIAAQATKALGVKICGVDMMIPDPKSVPTKENYTIIELNYNPVLFIHDYPYRGKRRSVAGPLLDLLGYPIN
ncbi:MAG: glutamate--cysteine ligase [Simkaniaceae bacterium]|nr:MAG: glutamate--cysteine ligase [Simkaniaceae bacterium]